MIKQTQTELYLQQGEQLRQQKRLDEAIDCYYKALRSNPYEVTAYRKLIEAFKEQGNWEKAAFYAYQAVTVNTFSVQDLASPKPIISHFFPLQNIPQTLKLGHCQKAIPAYRQAIEVNPSYSWSYNNLADALMKTKEWQEAIEAYRQAIELKPDNGWSHYNLGDAFAHLKQWDEAVKAYRHAIELNPEHGWSYYNLGDALAHLKQWDEAIEAYSQALQLNPDSSVTQQKLAEILEHKGRSYLEQASRKYQDVGQQHPHNIKVYAKALEIEPNNPENYLKLGNALATNNQRYQISSYQKNIRDNPNLTLLNWNQKKELGPDFIIIGAAKCGTTSLYNYLQNHPQILLPHKKELNFFTVDFQKGIEWYLSHFPPLADQADFITGEATPAYFDFPAVPERIYHLFPNVKLIVLLRNPIERTISWHYHKVNTGFEKDSLEVVINTEFKKIRKMSPQKLIEARKKRAGNLLGSLILREDESY